MKIFHASFAIQFYNVSISTFRARENGVEHPAKRHQTLSPHSRVSPNGVLNLTNGPIRLEDISIQRELREREKLERDRVDGGQRIERDRDFDRERHFPPYSKYSKTSLNQIENKQ